MSSGKNTLTVTIGVRWWLKYAVFAAWVIYYSMPFQAWRDSFGDWACSVIAKRATLVRVWP